MFSFRRPKQEIVKLGAVIWAVLTILGGVISYFATLDYFKVEVVDEKYCYYYNPLDTMNSFDRAYIVENFEDIKDIEAYYKLLYDSNYIKAKKYSRRSNFKGIWCLTFKYKIDVLEYKEDSNFAKILDDSRGKWVCKGYVPTYLLHDTLPKFVMDTLF
jgi:hypothetical protein